MWLTIALVTSAVASVLYVKRQYEREVPLLAKRLGFTRRGRRFEMALGDAIVEFRSSSATTFTLSLDMTKIVGQRLGLKKRLFGSKSGVTGDALLDRTFDITDPLAATAFVAPASEDVIAIFADTATDQTLTCEHGVFVLKGTQSHVLAEADAWLTRFKLLTRIIEGDRAAVDVRLRRNMLQKSPGLRLRSLHFLEHAYSGSPSHQAAIQDGLLDADPSVRVEAARQGRRAEVLRVIVRDRSVLAGLRIGALTAHGEIASDHQHTTLLTELVTDAEEDVSLMAIRQLKTRGTSDLAPRFVRLLDVAKGERQHAVLDALSRLGTQQIEGALVEHLSSFDEEGKKLACAALGRFGTVQSVPALRALRGAKQEAELAIARIQRRVAGAEAGQLSVASEGGEVSLHSDAAKDVKTRR